MPHLFERFAALSLAVGCAMTLVATRANAAPPAMGAPEAFPLYCHGAGTMKTEILDDGGSVQVDTSFTWASTGAGAQAPAAGQCAWADRGPRGTEIKGNNGNYLCQTGNSRFHAIFGAGHSTENSGENQPLAMAPVVVELPAPEFAYIPGIVTTDAFYKFAVFRDESRGNCMHVRRYMGVVQPPFSASPSL